MVVKKSGFWEGVGLFFDNVLSLRYSVIEKKTVKLETLELFKSRKKAESAITYFCV